MDAALPNGPQIFLFIFRYPGFEFRSDGYSRRKIIRSPFDEITLVSLHLQKLSDTVANFHCHLIPIEPFDRIVCYIISHLLICCVKLPCTVSSHE